MFVVSAETKGRSGSGARLSYIEFINCLMRLAVIAAPAGSDSKHPGSARSDKPVDVIEALLTRSDYETAAGAAVALATSVDRAFRVLMVRVVPDRG